jgi:hypothetical protein
MISGEKDETKAKDGLTGKMKLTTSKKRGNVNWILLLVFVRKRNALLSLWRDEERTLAFKNHTMPHHS